VWATALTADATIRRASFANPALRAALLLVTAVAAGSLLVQLLMRPPASDLRALVLFMAVSGVATLIAGALVYRVFDRAGVLSLRRKVVVGAVIGAVVGLLNVLIVAKLMFVSTAHDLRLLAALIGFSSLVALGFSVWVASTVTAQIDRVADALRTLARGDYKARVPRVGGDEVARLADDVNALAERLQEAHDERIRLDRDRRDLTAAISHDLRTPLASIRAMAEALSDAIVSDPREIARYHMTIRREVEHLGRMVDDLFQLSQIDAGALRLERRPVALYEIAAEVVESAQARASAAGVALALQADNGAPSIEVDGALVERAIANLLSNALEHTPAGGSVTLAVRRRDSVLALDVRDSGDGIDAADLPRVWDRFFRAERSRPRPRQAAGSDGVGLGLAIVRGIVEAHGGSVGVQSAPARGSTFTLEFPLQR
jgi:signal transduction histidine kinase